MGFSNMYCVIYLLKNVINSKVYVGQTWRPLSKRFSEGYRHSHHIKSAINKYGKDNFYYVVLTVCHTQQIADYWEKYFIVKYDSINNGYNLREGGSNGKLSEETKRKISKAQSGENGFWYGKTMPLDTKIKMSNAHSGENNPFHGKTHGEENLTKMRANHKNKPKKFNEADITAIKHKALSLSYTEIAKEYGVFRRVISHVVNDKGAYKKAG